MTVTGQVDVNTLLITVVTGLLSLVGCILWVIWSEIKGLRKSRWEHDKNLLWLNFQMERVTGEGYDADPKPRLHKE